MAGDRVKGVIDAIDWVDEEAECSRRWWGRLRLCGCGCWAASAAALSRSSGWQWWEASDCGRGLSREKGEEERPPASEAREGEKGEEVEEEEGAEEAEEEGERTSELSISAWGSG